MDGDTDGETEGDGLVDGLMDGDTEGETEGETDGDKERETTVIPPLSSSSILCNEFKISCWFAMFKS